MNRREFVKRAILVGATVALGTRPVNSEQAITHLAAPSNDLQLIDAHAHPDMIAAWRDHSASYRHLVQGGVCTGVFSVAGDYASLSGPRWNGNNYGTVVDQLQSWSGGIIKESHVKLVLKAEDIPPGPVPSPGAILGIEGGDALEGKLARVDQFHQMGVRIITVVHAQNNEIGDSMYPMRDSGITNNGLSAFGRSVVGQMEQSGILVDVAHSSYRTLQDIVAICTKPVIDSHTGVCPPKATVPCMRTRPWRDMELVAKTGGVVCSWPYRLYPDVPKSFLDWAREVQEMKNMIGMEHIGLGTDTGGSLPRVVTGYRNQADLPKLLDAMGEVGFSLEEIKAFAGGNFIRVFRQCCG
jgi:microsomal dipeptidase-like Zn-dependent dipeptidase